MNIFRNRKKNNDGDADGTPGSPEAKSPTSIRLTPSSPHHLIPFSPGETCRQARSFSLHRITKIPEPGQEVFVNLRTDFLRAHRANTTPSTPISTKHNSSRGRHSSDPLAARQQTSGFHHNHVTLEKFHRIETEAGHHSVIMSSPGLLRVDTTGSSMLPSRKRVEDAAKDAQHAVAAKLKQVKAQMPPFDFLEIIGKGSYGLVYKARSLSDNGKIVALKIIDTDGPDYKAHVMGHNDSMDTTLSEIHILKQLCSVNTKNVNTLLDVFQVHSQIWMVTEFCPGGSVRTLMRALPVKKLPDKYMIPIARELAIALESIHAAGVIHRDIKAANIMIHEEGMLRVIDFGVSAVLLSDEDKRKTIIGTPHWMAPEMHKRRAHKDLTYGTEIDVWAYGCTLIECATGAPPFANLPPNHQLAVSASRSPPRLNKEDHPEGLADIVASALNPKPTERPSMTDLLQESYILNTHEAYPTSALSELVKTFAEWQDAGGERASLFMAGGAQAADFSEDAQDDGDWNFSTTADFRASFFGPPKDFDLGSGRQVSHSRDSSGESMSLQYTPGLTPPPRPRDMDDWSPPQSAYNLSDDALNAAQHAQSLDEASVKRGERALGALFDESKAPYSYPGVIQPQSKSTDTPRSNLSRTTSDLPLRSETDKSTITSKEIIAGLSSEPSRDSIPNIDLANVNTIKANKLSRFLNSLDNSSESEDDYNYLRTAKEKRETLAWQFPKEEHPTKESHQKAKPQKRATTAWTFDTAGERDDDSPTESSSPELPVRPALVHSRTAPVGNIPRAESGIMDLDAMYLEGYGSDSDYRSALASDNEEDEETQRPDFAVGASQSGIRPLSRDESLLPTPTAPFAEHAAAVRDRLSSSTKIDFRAYDIDFDPEMEFFDEQEEKDQITAMLERQEVIDLEIPLLRKKILQARNQAREGGHEDVRNGIPKASLDDYDMEPQTSSWDVYSPDARNLSSSTSDTYSLSQYSHLDESLPSSALQTASSIATSEGSSTIKALSTAARGRRQGFPEVMPPSVEALEDGASEEVIEAELGRLLGDWVQGLEFMAGVGVGNEEEGAGDDS